MDRFLRNIVLGSSVTLLSMVVIKAMALVNSVIAARLLDPSDYGALSIILNLQNLTVIVACFGIPLALTKYISESYKNDPGTARSIGSALLLVLVLSTSVTAAVYLGLSQSIAEDLYGDPTLTAPIRLSAMLVLMASMNLGFASLLQGCQKIKILAKVNAAVAVIAQPLTFTAILAAGLEGAIAALIISNAIGASIFMLTARKVLGMSWHSMKAILDERRHIRSYLSFTIPAFIAGLTLILAHWIGRTNLAIEWDLAQVGQFQIADSLSQILLMFSAAMSVPLLPMISEQDATVPEEVGRNAHGLLHLTGVVAIPLSFFTFPFLGFVIEGLYGPEYAIAYIATVVMFSSATFKLISSVVSNVVLGTGRVWQALWMNLAWFFVFLVLMFILVGEDGSKGLATAYSASFALYLLGLLAYFRFAFSVPVSRIAVLAVIYALAVATFVLFAVDHDFWTKLIYCASTSAGLAVVGYYFVLSNVERHHLRTLIKAMLRRLKA